MKKIKKVLFSFVVLIALIFILLLTRNIIFSSNVLPMNNQTEETNLQNVSENLPPPPAPVPPGDDYTVMDSKIVTLKIGVPLEVFDTTLVLKHFNHKFQDSADASHEWAGIDILEEDTPTSVKSINLSVSKNINEQGEQEVFYAKEETSAYVFTILELHYNDSVKLLVEKKQ